jgi:hypothetical protein
MKTRLLPLAGLLLALSLACSGSAQPATPTPPQDNPAATQTAVQATIDASVNATLQAGITPTPADLALLSEEDTVAAVTDSVDTCAANTESAAASSTTAAADGTVTSEELDQTYADYQAAYADLNEAYSLIYGYYEIYGELAGETLELLYTLEDDLDELADALAELNTTLLIIQAQLLAGAQPAADTLAQLQTQAAAAQAAAASAQAQAETWSASHAEEIAARIAAIASVQPDNAPNSRKEATESAWLFLDQLKAALADGLISREELDSILLARANAAAGIEQHGGPALQAALEPLNQLARHAAAGDIPAALGGIGAFEAQLPERPALP